MATDAGKLSRPYVDPLRVRRIKVAIFIPNFRIGGAERQAFELAKHLDKSKYDVFVVALRGDGRLRQDFESLPNVGLLALDANRGLPALFRVIGELRKSQIQILHSFLLATSVYSLLAALFLPRMKVIVALRDAIPDSFVWYNSSVRRMQTRMLTFCLGRLRYFADLFISNSEAGRVAYEKECGIRSIVISNGIDMQQFKPDPAAGDLLRGIVGVTAGTRLIGIVANCTGYKDYPTFVRAAKAVTEKVQNVHFVSIGEDRTPVGAAVKHLVRQSGVGNVFHFLGARRDVHHLLPGLDVLCSASVTEGFPNAIAEAMACGVPCVATDVGDSRRIVGDVGIVVPSDNPEALALGVLALLDLGSKEMQNLRLAARQRIARNFGAALMATEHEQAYELLLAQTSHGLAMTTTSD